ncbi:DUF421 domain-containing protein [Bacillus sp. FJAT-26390]|uniref:DUF421 domain-containing protein n=1 Tax=Bacillus sp. FJAT-26390 TaxID=1743142 RepID=UPI000807BCE0|nr:DUF421 domain-containing protein [Bacillus sp. FJAT-26390]OBZ08240.1 hypothetical protein A7975_28430 [Bacillus sp. FJAT-26390]
MENYLPILIKLIVAFAGLWCLTRLLGKREIAQLSPFDFVSSMIMGEIVGNTIYDENVSVWMLIFALALWAGLSYFFEKIMEFGKALRRQLEGKPELLIVNGQIDMEALRRNNMAFDELRMMLRQRDVFSLSDVAYAVYETNGALSILKKSAFDTVQRGDLNLQSNPPNLPHILVEDGVPQHEGLAAIKRDEKWLLQELEQLGYPEVRSVALAEWTTDGVLKAIPRFEEKGDRKISFQI